MYYLIFIAVFIFGIDNHQADTLQKNIDYITLSNAKALAFEYEREKWISYRVVNQNFSEALLPTRLIEKIQNFLIPKPDT